MAGKLKKRKLIKVGNDGFDSGPRPCKNCGHVDTGNYCSNCGQRFSNINKPFREVFEDVVGMFSFDASFFRTIIPFLIKPGFLTKEFLEGRRKRYMSPVRLYLFLSILFFFMLRLSTQKAFDGHGNNLVFNADSSAVTLTGSGQETIPIDSLELLLSEDSVDYGAWNFNLKGKDTASATEVKLENALKNAVEKPASFFNDILQYASYALFLLMPLFALLLKLLYIRRKRYYIEHLIFSVNMHSFALLILTLVVAFELIFGEENDFFAWIILLIPVYFVTGMKRFYRQGFMKIIAKTILLGLVYLFLITVVMILIAVLALF